MPRGMWRRHPPLPPTPGTTVVCPIGEATPAQAADYRAARSHEEDDMDESPEVVLRMLLARIAELEAALAAAIHRAETAERLAHALGRPAYDPTRIRLEDR